MAKKTKSRKSSKRKRTQRRPVAVAQARNAVTASASATTQAAKGRRGPRAQAEADFAQEYGYVYADLRRVAVIAAAMLVILVILAFVLA